MPTWVFIKITESNCSEIARAAVQRCKELDDMVYKFPFKMYRYADKFWDKKEIISFLENTIYKHGIYYTATSHGTPVLKPYTSQLKKVLMYTAALVRQHSSRCPIVLLLKNMLA